jgi:hypothetical protein
MPFFKKIPLVRAVDKIVKTGKKASGGDVAGQKIRPGKKYGRLQKYETLNRGQKDILKKFGRHISPDKFQAPGSFSDALQVLRQNLQPIQATQTENMGQNFLQNLMNPSQESTQQFAAPYMRQFNEQIVPGLANQFAGTGSLNSSGFQQALGSAGSDLMERLAALKGNLGLQGAQAGLGYSQLPMMRQAQQEQNAHTLLGPSLIPQQMQTDYDRYADQRQMQQRSQALGTTPFGYLNVPPQQRQPGFLQSMAPGLAGAGVSAGIGAMIGGPPGALAGAQLGSGIAGGGGGGGGSMGWLSSIFGGGGGAPRRQMFSPEGIL